MTEDITKKISITIDEIKEAARNDGGFNIPSSDAAEPVGMEVKIAGSIQAYYHNGEKEYRKNHKNIEGQILSSKEMTSADGHDSQILDLKRDCQFIIEQCKARIKRFSENLTKIKRQYKRFTLENNLSRQAVLKSTTYKVWAIILVVFMLSVELYFNTFLLLPAVPGGIIGAIAISAIVSAINILSSFLAGRMVIPNLFIYQNKNKRNFSIFVLIIYGTIVIYFNLVMGVLRSLGQAALETFSTTELTNATRDAVFPFDNFFTPPGITFESIGLIVIGLLFAIISLIDGYKFDDEYPGFSQIARMLKRAQQKYDTTVESALEDLNKTSKQGLQNIETFKNIRNKANLDYGDATDQMENGFKGYKVFAENVINYGKRLYQIYRAENIIFRDTPVPAYFEIEPDFDIDTDPIKVFSAQAYYDIGDAQKTVIMEENREIIMKEYNESTAKLYEYYDDQLTNLKNYIQSQGH